MCEKHTEFKQGSGIFSYWKGDREPLRLVRVVLELSGAVAGAEARLPEDSGFWKNGGPATGLDGAASGLEWTPGLRGPR